MINTVTVTLHGRTKTGTDAFNQPVYTIVSESVSGVLVGEPSSDDVTNAYTQYGARVLYTLAIPKGDTHDWNDVDVTLPAPFAGTYHTIGAPTAGIESNIPGPWNIKVRLERHE